MKFFCILSILIVFSLSVDAQDYVTCPKCDGTGKTTYQSWENCSNCNGSGIQIDYVTKKCPQCHGTKKMKDVDRNGNIIEVPCNWPYCNNGYYKDQVSKTCEKCNGKKGHYVNKLTTCSKCFGKGHVLSN